MNSFKFLHIFPYNLYTKAFLQFTRMFFPMEEHGFLVYGKPRDPSFEIPKDDGTIILPSLKDALYHKEAKKCLKDAEKLFFHTNNVGVTNLLLQHPLWLKKTYIVFWGFDIYGFRNKANGIKERMIRQLQKYHIRHAKGICTLVDKDRAELEKLIPGIRGEHHRAVYMITVEREKFFERIHFEKSREPYKILVGNSASKTNQHQEILDQLSRYKDENILVYCPLSYGDSEYRDEVIAYGKGIFGEKFVPLTTLLPVEEYREYLHECVAGFFNNDRQQGMGNISSMLGMGAKVFIRTDTVMWEKFKKDQYFIYDIGEVGKVDWQTLISISHEEQESNRHICEELSGLERKKEIWEKIFKG